MSYEGSVNCEGDCNIHGCSHVGQAHQGLGLWSSVMLRRHHLNEALVVRLDAVDVSNDYL